MSDIEREVTVNHDQELYVIDNGTGVSCLGFDVALDRLDRMCIELTGRDSTFERPAYRGRGTLETFDLFMVVQERLRQKVKEEGDRAVYDLSPQLNGLEGWRVEVVDEEGDAPRRFIVGKSTGWAPCHLEILRRTSHGGGPARLEYRSVKQIERVR